MEKWEAGKPQTLLALGKLCIKPGERAKKENGALVKKITSAPKKETINLFRYMDKLCKILKVKLV